MHIVFIVTFLSAAMALIGAALIVISKPFDFVKPLIGTNLSVGGLFLAIGFALARIFA